MQAIGDRVQTSEGPSHRRTAAGEQGHSGQATQAAGLCLAAPQSTDRALAPLRVRWYHGPMADKPSTWALQAAATSAGTPLRASSRHGSSAGAIRGSGRALKPGFSWRVAPPDGLAEPVSG